MRDYKSAVRACAVGVDSKKMEGESIRARCVKAFRNATRDGQEKLGKEDYKVAVIELLGYKPSKYELENVWKACLGEGQVGSEFGLLLDLETFVSHMSARLKEKDQDEWIREVFVALDVYQRGFLHERDCIAAFRQVVPHVKEEVVKELFAEADSNADGKVSYRDFEIMMKSTKIYIQ